MEDVRRKTILLVEDEPVVAQIQLMALDGAGYDVVHVATGEESVAVIESGRPYVDLVLMDINLGDGIDGIEAARRILALFDIPIIFLTSYTDTETVRKTESISAYGYVVKNAGVAVTIASISMALKLREAYRGISDLKAQVEETNRELRTTIEELEKTLARMRGGAVTAESAPKTIDIELGELQYQHLFNNLVSGYAVLELLRDDRGAALDCRFIVANPAFGAITGLAVDRIVGTAVSAAMPGFDRAWLERLCLVAQGGQTARFDEYARLLKTPCVITAYQSAPGQCLWEFRPVDESSCEASSFE